ncbi:MAG: phosphatase PAP2 family protein [Tolypothrix sp. T3-bin4]|nr:phosphatase PAP2 family protein [Tolypothrix sp. T3-bin4]
MFDSDLWKLFQSFLSFLKKLLVAHWRSLLALLIGVYVPLQGFGLLAVEVWKNEGGFPWDVPILLAIHERSQPQLDTFAAVFTKLGVFWGVFPVATAIGLMLLRQRRWRSLAFLVVTLLGSAAINRTAKAVFHRVRPHLWETLSPKLDFAFPSGHAMSSMSLVATLVILSWGTRWRLPVLIFGSGFVVAIAWTRLYLGVHFPSDILAGWMISLAWVVGVSLVIRPNFIKPSGVDGETSLTKEENEAVTQA